jgi:hypothetical protein
VPWNYLWIHPALTGKGMWETTLPYAFFQTPVEACISWVIASSLHSSCAFWHTDVFCFHQLKVALCGQNLWLNFFQTIPLPQSWKMIALPCPILWHHTKGIGTIGFPSFTGSAWRLWWSGTPSGHLFLFLSYDCFVGDACCSEPSIVVFLTLQ